MPAFYCDYCKILLKTCSPLGRKEHNRGKRHIYNKIEYFNSYLLEWKNVQKKSNGPANFAGPPPQRLDGQMPGPPMDMHHPGAPMLR